MRGNRNAVLAWARSGQARNPGQGRQHQASFGVAIQQSGVTLRIKSLMKKVTVAVLTFGFWLVGAIADDKAQNHVAVIPPAWIGTVTDAAQLPVEQSAWGTLQ